MPPSFIQYVVLDVPGVSDDSSFMGVFQTFSGLETGFDVLEYREGGNNDFVRRLPGRMSNPNLTLAWGLSDSDKLLQWFMQTQANPQPKEITLTLASDPAQPQSSSRRFVFADAFPVRWSGPAGAAAGTPWTESLEIAHSGLKLPT